MLKKIIIATALTCSMSLALAANVLVITDIHFNVFSSCKTGGACPLVEKLVKDPVSKWSTDFASQANDPIVYKSDTNYHLLRSTLSSVKKQTAMHKPIMALALGDFLGHHFEAHYAAYSGQGATGYAGFVTKTLQFLHDQLQASLPSGMLIYPVVGNNDSDNGDYYVAKNQFFSSMAQAWPDLKPVSSTFDQLGYYAIKAPIQNTELVVINSVLFSPKAVVPVGASLANYRTQEINWLNQTLAAATKAKQKVWLLMHIPLGVNAYASVAGTPSLFWDSVDSTKVINLIRQYSDTITDIFASHIHDDAITAIPAYSEGGTHIMEMMTPAVSPVYGNNPAYKIYQANDAGQLTNYQTYNVDLSQPSLQWNQEYDFVRAYPYAVGETLNQRYASLLAYIAKDEASDSAFAKTYRQYFAAGTNAQPISEPANWRYYLCSILAIDSSTYKSCLVG